MCRKEPWHAMPDQDNLFNHFFSVAASPETAQRSPMLSCLLTRVLMIIDTMIFRQHLYIQCGVGSKDT